MTMILRWPIAISLLIGLAVACAGLWVCTQQIDPAKHLAIEKAQGGSVVVTSIAGHDYQIPVGYFRYAGLPPARLAPDVLIDAALPDMHVIIPGSSESPEVTHKPWGSIVNILIADEQITTSHAFRWTATQATYGHLTRDGEVYGLQRFISERGPSGMSLIDAVAWLEHPSAHKMTLAREEVYTVPAGGTPEVYIICNGDAAGPAPGCSAHFESDLLLFDVGFGKQRLKEWRQIKSAAISRMNGFRVRSSSHTRQD
jgi:hypothetical protein